MRTVVSLGILVIAGTAGDLALARAMKRIGHIHFTPSSLLRGVTDAIREAWIWIGLVLHAAAFAAFLTLLSWADVSVVVPASALSYITGVAGAKLFLRERIESDRWVGVLLIALGVTLVLAG